MQKTAVIISNDPEELDYLQFALTHNGIKVTALLEKEKGIATIKERTFDVIIVSTNDSPVYDLIEEIRSLTATSIVLVSDLLTERQELKYLDAGVGCVLQHPLSMRIFTRYTNIMMRRTSSVPSNLLNTHSSDSLELNPANRSVTVDGSDPKRLTPLEFRLLYILITNKGQVIPTEQLVERVWGYSGDGNKDLVRGLVRRVRRKLGTSEEKDRFIHNLPGEGYQFEEIAS